jgi:hypothetical protein
MSVLLLTLFPRQRLLNFTCHLMLALKPSQYIIVMSVTLSLEIPVAIDNVNIIMPWPVIPKVSQLSTGHMSVLSLIDDHKTNFPFWVLFVKRVCSLRNLIFERGTSRR